MISGIFLLTTIPCFLTQDIIFPGPVKGYMKINIAKKINPDPTECPANMAYIEEEDTCECETGTLYYPPTDSCYVPFQKGPCPPEKHLILPRNSNIAKCVVNTCGNNGTISYKNTCIDLLKPGPPCAQDEAVMIDQQTYELNCEKIRPILHQIISAPIRGCVKGSRKIANGQCRMIL